MPKYRIEVVEVIRNDYHYEVEASSEEEAEDLVDASPDDYLVYDYSKNIDGDSSIYEIKE